ncbi:MAG TPA: outer membrane beta-barrel protein, partial [Bacteroidia bacterium]|nr:outer membrane beta-barrel protein [Bacteroidia bacterium]
MFKKLSWLLFIFPAFAGYSQTHSIEGSVKDSVSKAPLIGALIRVIPVNDSVVKYSAVVDYDGNFKIVNVESGKYRLEASYISYNTLRREILVSENKKFTLLLSETAIAVGGVTITEKIPPVKQKGDTTEFNSEAYKTNPDANAEDLVRKMPGVTIENGQVKAQGEDVKKVLVDGKEFFGEDPASALKNLPADMIDKVQVFDRASDQAAFSGVDDGNQQKTINIITKKDRREGVFGKVYAGYGTNDRYQSGLSLNVMNGAHRFTIIGMSNNINQQNFASEDLLGISGGGGGRGMRRGGPGGAASNFMVGQQRGISTTHSFGLNYSGDLSKRLKLTGSYFFNSSENVNNQDLNRTTFLSGDSSQLYHEESRYRTNSNNHRFNFRMEYTIDSFNSIILTPRLSLQTTGSNNSIMGESRLQAEQLINSLQTINGSAGQGYTFNNDLLYRHRFAKPGRTFSINLGTGANNRLNDNFLRSDNTIYAGSSVIGDSINQEGYNNSNGHNLSSRVSYTEPLSSKTTLQFTYNVNRNYSEADKRTFNFTGNEYSQVDSALSSTFNTTYTTQSGGLDFDYKIDSAADLSLGLDYQVAVLNSNMSFPRTDNINRPFYNLLPNARFSYKFSEKSNIRIRYRTRTNAPSVSQLQNVTDNSNPVLLSRGNPNLKQELNHMLFGRWMKTNVQKARSLFIMAFAQTTQDYIGNSTLVAQRDTVIDGVDTLRRGSQLTRPVNLNGYWNVRGFVVYSMPVGFIKSNLNS